MNEILDIKYFSELTAELTISAPAVAKACRTGHFVIVRFAEDGARIPFSIIDSDPEAGTIGIIIHRAAGLGDILQHLKKGDCLPDLLGPLGQALDIRNYGTVVCCGDGAGFVPLIPIVRALREAGNRVISVFSEQTAQTTCLMPKIEQYSEIVDASEADVTAVVKGLLESNEVSRVVVSGPTVMMQSLAELTRPMGLRTLCILNMMMIDGVGLCGICRVMVDGRRMLTCIDGPAFDAHKVDFEQLLYRQRHFV